MSAADQVRRPQQEQAAMSDFRKVTETFWASPQISQDDVAEASRRGFTLIINNRPDGEDDGQPDSQQMASACAAQGLDYVHIPVTHAGFSEGQVATMADALEESEGPVLAFCRSGTRSTLLWALAEAKLQEDPATLAATAMAAGYDVSPIRPLMDMLAGRTGEA
jgi:uncharacterized protein (TIGR01244 family)